ncbi:MAG TPA: hypothetical protein ENJ68_02830 [Devosia sp.]|nr:hypothetical protein [Devosia sp.]
MDTRFSDEMKLAARGTLAVLTGKADAARYFDFSHRGLAGSFIAFLIAITLNAYLPDMLGGDPRTGSGGPSPSLAVFMALFLFVLQTVFGAFALKQFDRMDGFIPYLVADNWATFFITILSLGLILLDVSPQVFVFGVGGAVLVSEINISRLIVTLKPMQVVMFLLAQFIGILTGVILVGTLLPAPAGA